MEATQIVSNYHKLKSERSNVEGIWTYMERYVLPYKTEVYESTGENGVNWRKRDIYDSTAAEACDALAASLQGSLVSPSARWFDLNYHLDLLNEDQDAKEWLEECADTIFMSLQSSNFNLEVAESMLDLAGYGTMALIEEWDDEEEELTFTSIPISDVFFEPGANSQVLRFYRKLEWTTLQLIDKFGEEALPEELRDSENPSEKHEVIWCVYEIPENKKNNTSQMLKEDKRPYGYKYIMVSGAHVLKEGGYYELPSYVTRWRTTAGSQWGNGPGFKVLATIMDVNELSELVLEEAALAIEPPLMTTQRGIMSDLDRSRAGLTVVNSPADIGLLPTGGDAQLSLLSIADLRNQIRRAFYEDQLELKESPAMTATEVNVRYELMQRLLGPTMGRLKSELLDPLVTRTFRILYRAGKLPEPPEFVVENQGEFDIEYLGPLPRSQKLDTAQAVAGFIGQIASMAQTFPTVLDVIDVDAAIRGMGEFAGVPTKFMRTQAEVDQIRQQRAQAMQKQQQIQEAKAEGEAMRSVGEGAQALPSGAIEDLQNSIRR